MSRTAMESPHGSETVARLMADFRMRNRAAANRLVELLYPELRKLAATKMRGERTEHTWQPTLPVNELYLALIKIRALEERDCADGEKAAFLGLAGHVIENRAQAPGRGFDIGELGAACIESRQLRIGQSCQRRTQHRAGRRRGRKQSRQSLPGLGIRPFAA